MIAIAGRPIPFTVDFGKRKSGLSTVGYELLNADGTLHAARTTTGVSHVVGGIYLVDLTIVAHFAGMIVWDTGEEEPVYASEEILAASLDYLDAAVSSRATTLNLAGTSISVIGPVATTGDITIIGGDDYLAGDSRALVWEEGSGAIWPSLEGARSIELEVLDPSQGALFSTPGEASLAPEVEHHQNKRVTVPIHGTSTAGVEGKHRYRLSAVLSDGSDVTLATGTFIIQNPFTGR